MAPNPPPNRKRGRPPGASTNVSLPRRSRNEAQPGKRSGNAQKQAGQRKQSTLRESWVGSSRRDGRVGDDDDDDDDDDDQDVSSKDGDDSERARKRGRTSNAARRDSLGTAGVIGRRGIPQPNQAGTRGAAAQDKQRPGQRDQSPGSNREASSSAAAAAAATATATASPPKPYVHVAPHTRRVRQSAIEARWTPLANASLTAVSTTLQDAQRPVLQRVSDSQLRRDQTASALRLAAHGITRKISRGLPFPPASMPANVGRAPLQSDAGRDVELNFESVLDGRANLERQLQPALDALDLLRREKDALEADLERDYQTLRDVEAGVRARAREQRGLLRRAHVLAPAAAPSNPDPRRNALIFDLVRHDDDAATAGAFTNILDQDDDIHPLAIQLGTHVDNIRANLEQTDGLTPHLARSKAALRAVLLRHLDLRLYEQVVLG